MSYHREVWFLNGSRTKAWVPIEPRVTSDLRIAAVFVAFVSWAVGYWMAFRGPSA